MRFRVLIAEHQPSDPPEATLVLAAAAAHNGLRADGEPMPGAQPHAPSLRELAAELGLHVGAVRRGVRHLEAAGAVRVAAGVHVDADALRARWRDPRQRIRASIEVRKPGMRAGPLLLAALVAGQLDARGRLCLGRGFLSERTGMPLRTLDRALASAVAAGALHRWTAGIGRGQLFLALGPSRTGEREASRSGERERRRAPPAPPERREPANENTPGARREAAKQTSRTGEPPVANRRTMRREAANETRTLPEYSGPSDARASARGASFAGEGGAPAPEPRERDPVLQLQAAILRTSLRSKLPSLARLRFAFELAPALHRSGMTADDLDALWALATARTNRGDAGGLLSTWLAGNWRDVLAEQVEKARHRQALARGRAASGRHERDPTTEKPPAAGGDIAHELISRLNHG